MRQVTLQSIRATALCVVILTASPVTQASPSNPALSTAATCLAVATEAAKHIPPSQRSAILVIEGFYLGLLHAHSAGMSSSVVWSLFKRRETWLMHQPDATRAAIANICDQRFNSTLGRWLGSGVVLHMKSRTFAHSSAS